MWPVKEKNTLRRGTIISFNSNFVIVVDDEIDGENLCTLRGRFKLTNTKPAVGDRVEYIMDHDRGRIESILPRTNLLNKPKVSNVDMAVIVISLSSPDVPFNTVDRILFGVSMSNVKIILVLNKIDITDDEKITEFTNIYKVYDTLFTSTFTGQGIDELKLRLKDHISVFAGPSGVGKSSILNFILKSKLKIGSISDSTNLGKHTTTSASLLKIEGGGFVVDTPGFTTIEFEDIEPHDVQKFFPEIKGASYECAFDDCTHEAEPGCNVKAFVDDGRIPVSRYRSYINILKEVKKNRGVRFEKSH